MRTLLVEDDPDALRLLATYIRSYGYNPDCFENAEDALAAYQAQPYAFVITDWQLPGMDGLELIRRLRREKRGHDCYIMMLTSRDHPEQLREAMAAGADDYLTKPMDPRLLGVRVLIAEQRVHKRSRDNFLAEEARLEQRESENGNGQPSSDGNLVTYMAERETRVRRIQERLEAEIARRSEAEQILRDRDNLYRIIVTNMPGSVFLYDHELQYRMVIWDDLEYDREPGIQEGKKVWEAYADHKELAEILLPNYRAALFGTANIFELSRAHQIYSVHTLPVRDDDGAVIAGLEIRLNITETRRIQDRIRENEERYELAARGANDGLWDYNIREDRVYYSIRWRSIVGIVNEDTPHALAVWLDRVHPDDQERVRVELHLHIDGKTQTFSSEHRLKHRDGHYLWVLCRGLAVRDDEGPYRMAGSLTDITDRKRVEEDLVRNALYDSLTGLPNRALLMDRLRTAWQRFQESRDRATQSFGVLSIDLDRFKMVNETFGHETGDELLRRVAERLSIHLGPRDTLARLSGDHFVVILEEISDEEPTRELFEILRDDLGDVPFLLGEHEIYVNVSMGLVFASEEHERPEDLLRDSEIAMFRAKEKGVQYEVFRTFMNVQSRARMNLQNELRRAMQENQLSVHYQPIVDIREGRIVGVESLLRWVHPGLGFISPAQFIPIAEETGMILHLGEWVLRAATRQNLLWSEHGIYTSVNLSPRQFMDEDLFEKVRDCLVETGIPPERLVLEITESNAMADINYTVDILRRIRDLGVRLFIDDFGTGYSSLSYLKRFPIQSLKIDKSFTGDLGTDSDSEALTSAIIALASGLGISAIAEGVEKREQVEFLRERGCYYVQGYFFGKPVDADTLATLLRTGIGAGSDY